MKWKVLYNRQCPHGHETISLTVEADSEEEAMQKFKEMQKDMYRSYFLGRPEKVS